MSDVKLLPCPFCGANVCEIAFDDDGTGSGGVGRRARVECSESESCFANTGWQDDIAAAIAAWNERPAPALTPKQEAADEIAKALQGIVAALELGGKMKRGQFYYYGVHDPAMTKPLAKAKAALAKAGQP